MNRLLTIIFVFLLLFITAEAGFLLFLNRQSSNLNPPSSTLHPPPSTLYSPPSNPSLPPDFKILYQDPNDKEGRTIIYESKNHKYSGVGEFYDQSTSPARLTHIIGVFEKWEEIPGSKDKYLILTDPISKKPLKKTRVAFERSDLFDQGTNSTALAIENINKNKQESLKKQLLELSNKTIDGLIKKGDAIIIIPLYVFDRTGKIIDLNYDQNKMVLAGWLTVRRKKEITLINQ